VGISWRWLVWYSPSGATLEYRRCKAVTRPLRARPWPRCGIFDIDRHHYNHTISGKSLEVGKEGNKVVVSFAYERDIHLTGPAYLVMRYTGRSK
jgi:hypothetical protein